MIGHCRWGGGGGKPNQSTIRSELIEKTMNMT